MKGTIVFVTGSMNLSGADFSMYAIIKKLKHHGYDSLIVLPKECKSSDFWKKENISYITVPFKNWTASKSNFVYRFLVGIYKKINNKIMVCCSCNKINSKSKYPIVCIYNNGFTNDFAVSLAKKMKKKCVYHIREFGDLDFNWNYVAGNKIKHYNLIESDVQTFIAISNAVKNSFSNAKNCEKIKVVYNGIKLIDIRKKTNKDNKDNICKIVISGRLVKEKGHILLIKAIQNIIAQGIKNVQLDIYGDGKERSNIEHFIKTNHLEQYVNLKGFVLGIDYQQYDIGIMTSQAEAFGRVTVEYMMNGLVTIASNSGANPELITNYKDGILFDSGNEQDLTIKILEVIKSKKLRKEISENAIKTAIEKYSEETYVNNIYNLLVEENILEK